MRAPLYALLLPCAAWQPPSISRRARVGHDSTCRSSMDMEEVQLTLPAAYRALTSGEGIGTHVRTAAYFITFIGALLVVVCSFPWRALYRKSPFVAVRTGCVFEVRMIGSQLSCSLSSSRSIITDPSSPERKEPPSAAEGRSDAPLVAVGRIGSELDERSGPSSVVVIVSNSTACDVEAGVATRDKAIPRLVEESRC